MKKQIVLLAITLLLCLQGCGIVYVPSFSKNVVMQDFNTSLEEIDNFLEVGKTSMEEIKSAWGYPASIDDTRNIWLYIGEKTVGYYSMFWFLYAVHVEGVSVERYMFLFIKFDKNNCLERYELKRMVKNYVLDDEDIKRQVVEWDNSFETQSK